MRHYFLYIIALLIMLLCGACGSTPGNGAPPPVNASISTAPRVPTAPPPTLEPTLSPPQPALLAYVQHGDLWIAELPGTAPRRLSSDGAASAPRWSPSGDWLAYCQHERLRVVRRAGGDTQALGPCSGRWLPSRDELAFVDEKNTTIVDVASGQRRAVAHAAGAWRSDSAAFAYVELRLTGAFDKTNTSVRETSLWRAQSNGSAAKKLFDPGTPAPGGIVLAGWHDDSILFWTDPQFSASLLADGVPLNAVSANGGSARELVPFMLTHPDFLAADPDGTSIAVTEGGDRQTWTNKRIATIDLRDGTRTHLTDDTVVAFSPVWSPTGRQIAYVAGPDVGSNMYGGDVARAGVAQRHIWLVDRDGAHKRQLTADTAYHDERPRWTADGEQIAFVRVNEHNQPSLWTMRADGNDVTQIAPTLGPDAQDEEAWFGYYGYHNWDQFFDVWQPSVD